MAKTSATSAPPTFEAALARLEQIVSEMEGDRLALEDLLSRYEEGTALVKVCQQRLDAAEKRIEQITRGNDGSVKLDPFDPAAQQQQQASPPAAPARSSGVKKAPPVGNAEDVSLF
jgi:exodeoxyribonuclease VII small subunit